MATYLAILILLLSILHMPFRTAARSIPDNVRSFYNSVANSGNCTGNDLLQGGFHDTSDGDTTYSYCQKGVTGTAIYLKGPGKQLANMDVDCDGTQTGLDPRCGSSDDTQSQTAFRDQVQRDYGISDLRADIHPYVVLGNQGNYSPTFDPQTVGVLPLSIVAIICGEQLIYGIWGDTNGDDGVPLVGEASLAVATACFGSDITGNNGHDEADVLYVAFVGDAAVPGLNARWNASTYDEFEESIMALGDKLVEALPMAVDGEVANTTASTNAMFLTTAIVTATTTTTATATTSPNSASQRDMAAVIALALVLLLPFAFTSI